MLHAAGWLEGGLVMGYEKFVMDADQCAMIQRLLVGLDMSENGQGLSAIREVGPGSHYLGCAHTQANFETAFYRSPLADNNSFEQWESEGSMDMTQRAAMRVDRLLKSYEKPDMDAATAEALKDFVKQRKEAFPDSNI